MTSLVSGSALLLADDLSRTGASLRALQKAVARGEVVRIRRGAYCEAARWAALDGRGRHLLRMRAVAAMSTKDIVFCGASAAAAWDLPRPGGWDETVHVAVADTRGGRSHGDIRCRAIPSPDAAVAEVDGFLVTGRASTAVQEALDQEFVMAVGILDAALRKRDPRSVTRPDLLAELAKLQPRRHATRALAAIDLASPLSESFGESVARARLHELGFPPPLLQVPMSDERGFIGRVDFYWPESRVVGEFDGAVKYQRPEFLNGRTPEQALWLEKQREDRLRRQAAGVFRAVWADVMEPARLGRIARAAGLLPSPR
ncbi:MAG TPA: hypothetical protein VIL55_05695 [Naasia sp.]